MNTNERKISMRRACLLPLLLLSAIGVSSTMHNSDSLDTVEARVAQVERQYVEQLLGAYWDGVAVAGEQDPLVSRWRARILHATDAVALAKGADPDGIVAAAQASGAGTLRLEFELVIAVWDRLSMESKTVDRPTGPVFLSVSPPFEARLPSGVDPSAIEDEVLRAEYERAIQENRARAIRLRKAGELDKALETYSAKARVFLSNKLHGMSAQDRSNLENLLRQATHVNPDHVTKILGEP
jgi:hypothetical protein